MAESACLRRSFSNPTDTSLDFSQGNPIHALGDSISFGRYMSEPLAWEKWSAFSHNRYLEEAEKSSKPGSVAKMKAYFEAHYRKKQAALEQAKEDNSLGKPEDDDVELVSSSSSSSLALNPETVFHNSHSNVNEFRRSLSSPMLHRGTTLPDNNARKGTPNAEPLLSVTVSSCDASTLLKESAKEEADTLKSSSDIDCKEYPPELQVHQRVDSEINASITESSSETKIIPSKDALGSGIIPATPEKHVIIEKEAKDKLDPRSKQKPADMLLKSSKKSNVSKLSSSLARLATPVRPKMEGSGTPNNHHKFGRESVEKKNPTSKLSSSLARLATPVRPKVEGSSTPNNHHKFGRESVEKNNPTSKLVQKSIDVDSDVKLMKKSTPASQRTGFGKAFTPLGKMIRQSFAHSPAPSTSRASVNSVSRHPSATPQSDTKRSRIALEKSFARNKTDQKIQSPSVGHVKSAAQSPITFSPFNFRTEERAVKRKEFFERRLEKEAENLQLLEKAKVNAKANVRKTSQSVNFSNASVDPRREVLSDKTKIPIARPHAPKCESKSSTNLTRGKCSQPPRSSIGTKSASGNTKPSPVTLPTKKRHENASPNII